MTLTIGLLLTVGAAPVSLTLAPMLWGFIGGSAAVLLGVATDYVLLASGVLLLADVTGRGVKGFPRWSHRE